MRPDGGKWVGCRDGARWRRTAAAGVVAASWWLASGLAVGPAEQAGAQAADPGEAEFIAMVNGERLSRGLGTVAAAADLQSVALRHSEEMVRQDDLSHNPDLASQVAGWQLVGENVGAGTSVQEIHAAFMASAVHRDVIVQPRFTQIGVGVVRVGEEMWVTQVFRQPTAQTAPATTPPRTSVRRAPTAAGPARVGGGLPAPAPVGPRAVAMPTTTAPAAAPGAVVPAAPATSPVPDQDAGVTVGSSGQATAVSAAPVPVPAPSDVGGPGVVAAALLAGVATAAYCTRLRVLRRVDDVEALGQPALG